MSAAATWASPILGENPSASPAGRSSVPEHDSGAGPRPVFLFAIADTVGWPITPLRRGVRTSGSGGNSELAKGMQHGRGAWGPHLEAAAGLLDQVVRHLPGRPGPVQAPRR